MANSDISSVTEKLAKATVDEEVELDFSGRGLKLNEASDAKEIIDDMDNCKRLVSLRLEGNTLGVEAAKAIGKALESHPEFKKAQWKDMFTGRLKSEIPDALRYLSGGLMLAKAQLVELDLSDNAFGPIGSEGIKVLLESETCYTLQELRLNNNGLGIRGGEVLAKSLLNCYKNSSTKGTPLSLRVFVSGRNRLENDGAIALAKVFKTVGTLREVVMPQNGIYHKGITALAEALSHNENLKILNLNDNTFTEKGAASMAKAIPKLQNLEILNFGDCLIRTEGAKAVAAALKSSHESLKELYLGFNEITINGALAVVEALKEKPALEKVDLDGNKFGEEGCNVIRSEMKEIKKEDMLGSLSEDEGSDDDDEENEGEEDEDEESDDDDETRDTSNLQDVSTSSVEPEVKITPDKYLADPSGSRLFAVGTEQTRPNIFAQKLKNPIVYEDGLDLFMKISCVVTEFDGKLKQAACQCSDSVLEPVFKCAEDRGELSSLSNLLLVYLGLIKSEDKKFKPSKDILGPLVVLEHVVRQPYFPRTTKEVLQFFLSRPNKSVEVCRNAKHKLMQALYM